MSFCCPDQLSQIVPCVDHPAIKAIFSLKIQVENKEHIVISNTNLINQPEKGKPFQWYEFADTPLMSTYLFAFIIGRFDSYSIKAEKTQVQVTGYTPKD